MYANNVRMEVRLDQGFYYVEDVTIVDIEPGDLQLQDRRHMTLHEGRLILPPSRMAKYLHMWEA